MSKSGNCHRRRPFGSAGSTTGDGFRPAPRIEGFGKSASDFGKDSGKRPEKFASPTSRRAIASPPRAPGYQAAITPPTRSIHGMVIGPPVSSTTTDFFDALA